MSKYDNFNIDYDDPELQAEFERSQKTVDEGSRSFSDFGRPVFYYKWKDGENNLLFIGPWTPKGKKPFKRVYQFFNLPGKEMHLCIELSAPELELKCPILSTLNELEQEGHTVKKQRETERNAWQAIDLDGKIETIEIWDNDKKEKVPTEVDFSKQPQIVVLPKGAHASLFQFLYDPNVGAFFHPKATVPMVIDRYKDNGFMKYNVHPSKSLQGKERVIDRMEIGTDEEIDEIYGNIVEKDGKEVYEGGLIFDLDDVFRMPIEELQAPDGKIYKSALKLRAAYQTPGKDEVKEGNVYNPPDTQKTENKKVTPPPKKEEKQNEEDFLPSQELPKDTTEKKTKEEKKPVGKPKIPGSPKCFGEFETISVKEGSDCKTCPYAVLCKTQIQNTQEDDEDNIPF